MKKDISKAIDLALKHNPALAMKDLSTVHMWLDEGADMELDILPSMTQMIDYKQRRHQSIGSFSYFTNAIRTATDRRTIVASKTVVKSQEEKDLARAKNIKWHQIRGITTIKCGLQDFDWLEKYEEINGEVVS